MSDPRPLTHGVPQGSILGPILFLVMIADMPRSVIGDIPGAIMTGYADNSAVYVSAKNVNQLKVRLERVSSSMISYCQDTGLILNTDKTQLLVSPRQKCQFKMGTSLITASSEINLLGMDFDSNFSTKPYLKKLACAAQTRAKLISRLSFSMPPYVLSTLTHGLLMGKVMSACSVTIPVRLNNDDHTFISITEDINKAIKSAARTITRTKLSDRINSEKVLHKAKLKCLNEAVASVTSVSVWKSKQCMNKLGHYLFKEKVGLRTTRSTLSNKIELPVPGYPYLATNAMARIFNDIPELQTALTLSAAKSISKKWAKKIPR